MVLRAWSLAPHCSLQSQQPTASLPPFSGHAQLLVISHMVRVLCGNLTLHLCFALVFSFVSAPLCVFPIDDTKCKHFLIFLVYVRFHSSSHLSKNLIQREGHPIFIVFSSQRHLVVSFFCVFPGMLYAYISKYKYSYSYLIYVVYFYLTSGILGLANEISF